MFIIDTFFRIQNACANRKHKLRQRKNHKVVEELHRSTTTSEFAEVALAMVACSNKYDGAHYAESWRAGAGMRLDTLNLSPAIAVEQKANLRKQS